MKKSCFGCWDKLIHEWENEVVEFKQAGNDYKTDKIGEYFSALANEGNLRAKEKSWLVFGVNNKSRKVCGLRLQAGTGASAKHKDADGGKYRTERHLS